MPPPGQKASYLERDMLGLCEQLWMTREPQSIVYATDYGDVTVTVTAAWAAGDPRKERADDPPIC